MIKVNIEKNNTKIISLEVSGHSNYDEKGRDIVCAGVSAIVVGGLNALLNEKKTAIEYECKEGYSRVFVKNIDNDNIQKILDVITTQLYTIEESYPKFIKIIEK
jgi:uncharacterized protein YsxB (DUF464 family)